MKFIKRQNDVSWRAATREQQCEQILKMMVKHANPEHSLYLQTLLQQIHIGIRFLEKLYYSKQESEIDRVMTCYINRSPEIARKALREAIEKT